MGFGRLRPTSCEGESDGAGGARQLGSGCSVWSEQRRVLSTAASSFATNSTAAADGGEQLREAPMPQRHPLMVYSNCVTQETQRTIDAGTAKVKVHLAASPAVAAVALHQHCIVWTVILTS